MIVPLMMAGLAGCKEPCADGSVFVKLTMSGGAEGADSLDVALSVDNGTVEHRQVSRAPGRSSDSVTLAFPSGYPVNRLVMLTVAAFAGTTELAVATDEFDAARGCSVRSLTLDGSRDLAAGGDLSLPADGGTPSPPIFVGRSMQAALNTSQITLPPLQGVAAGDFLVLAAYAYTSTETLTSPVGWTPLTSVSAAQPYKVWWFTKVAVASEPPPPIVMSASVNELSAIVASYRGVRSTMPIDAQSDPPTNMSGAQSGTQLTMTATTPAASADGELASVWFVYGSGQGESFLSATPSLTKRADVGQLALYDEPAPRSTTTLQATATYTAGNTLNSASFVVDLATQ